MARGDDYRFLLVVDAFSSVNQRVNLIGVIIDYGIPKPTKGTDWFCSMRVVDESHNSRGLSVNFFGETNEKLPLVESSGDIIQLSNAVIKVHHKEIYALFNKKFSSFALYEGKNGETFTPYQASLRFCPGEQDKTHINGLRKWLDSFQLDIASRDSVSLREIKKGGRADLICMILHVYEVTTNEWMVFVWDGTDASRLQIQANMGDEKENPLPWGLSTPWCCCLLVYLRLNAYAVVVMGSIAEMEGFWVGLDGPLSTDIFGSFICSLAGYWPAVLIFFPSLLALPSSMLLLLLNWRRQCSSAVFPSSLGSVDGADLGSVHIVVGCYWKFGAEDVGVGKSYFRLAASDIYLSDAAMPRME
ncbi:hypothetical protein Nepgr_022796 [Nepenthes gracilis]|uniref:Telomeric single stranded DNA binding POT1/Cdc13 domain-containing protein n=1 Tax=Nepenthes gracilis TaxID=150966 RepID=A0AAD3XYF5_NEPGR|nr:hypothetical protein Nepgr_022796 [Nepenthes gracilis]